MNPLSPFVETVLKNYAPAALEGLFEQLGQ
jgi:hypothetical protein